MFYKWTLYRCLFFDIEPIFVKHHQNNFEIASLDKPYNLVYQNLHYVLEEAFILMLYNLRSSSTKLYLRNYTKVQIVTRIRVHQTLF